MKPKNMLYEDTNLKSVTIKIVSVVNLEDYSEPTASSACFKHSKRHLPNDGHTLHSWAFSPKDYQSYRGIQRRNKSSVNCGFVRARLNINLANHSRSCSSRRINAATLESMVKKLPASDIKAVHPIAKS